MNEFTRHHQSLQNIDLVRIVYFERRRTMKEARASAKAVLRKRGVCRSELKKLRGDIREQNQSIRRRKLEAKDNGYTWFDFLFEVILEIIFRLIGNLFS